MTKACNFCDKEIQYGEFHIIYPLFKGGDMISCVDCEKSRNIKINQNVRENKTQVNRRGI